MWLRLREIYLYFNSQPHEEADCHNPQLSHLPEYFNSQPHEEADCIPAILYIFKCISTHSLTRRLTVYHLPEQSSENYFNSQPHEEADIPWW